MGFRFHVIDADGKDTGEFLKEWDDEVTGVFAAIYYGKTLSLLEIEKLSKIFSQKRAEVIEKRDIEELELWLKFMQDSLKRGCSWECY